ncbi:hypothetical protein GOA58_05870 [Sinorhizobium meliloti]|uniref:hypothetical protein n=1 Tax=Rhizobium meliloti TaxID=382 RepID=UPI00299E87F2|nr:hypothetical protein [Sinorhizobium meliloti]MDW9660103.1 hypothetical protein [Sinorhizobium meliloti]MDX0049672.1 hypothetical protein [Sinorhizobium meliloti]
MKHHKRTLNEVFDSEDEIASLKAELAKERRRVQIFKVLLILAVIASAALALNAF